MRPRPCSLPRAVAMASALGLALVGGCGGDPDGPVLAGGRGALPPSMSALGLYPSATASGVAEPDPRAIRYRPALELWSNGSEKERFIVLPPGAKVDNSDPEAWEFPDGTLLFKTFSYPREEAAGPRPIETRVLRKLGGRWDYAVYLWNEAGTDAEKIDLASTVPVEVELEGAEFEHVVPARLDCRKCHESQESTVIGFDELRLNGPLAPGGSDNQLETLFDAGVLSEPPREDADRIEHPDPRTAEVLGYLHGNCAHCHNGGDGPSSSFDMRHGVALENLIGRETEGEALAGIRIVPGAPEESALYLALTRDESLEDIQAMPPVGVQRKDDDAIELIRRWIEALPPLEEDDEP